MLRRFIHLGIVAGMILSTAAAAAPFQAWSEKVFEHIGQEYGPEAKKRFRFLHRFIIDNQDLADLEKVKKANSTLNNLPWIADASHWKKADYWASPLETIATFGGDCEDIAIVKWVVLRNLGIQPDHLALAYVKIKDTGEDHMVLLYIVDPSVPADRKEIYVLDNYVEEVEVAAQRPDLLVVFAFNADGDVVLFNDDGRGRSVKGVYQERKIRQMVDLQKKIADDRQKFQDLNDGRPLLPPP